MIGNVTTMRCIMLTARFGCTVAYLEQLHLRMLREHVSFAGEANVAEAVAKKRGVGNLLPKRLRLYLSGAWYIWRLALRAQSLPNSSGIQIDLLKSVEGTLQEAWPWLDEQFAKETARRARNAGMRTDIHVVDGKC